MMKKNIDAKKTGALKVNCTCRISPMLRAKNLPMKANVASKKTALIIDISCDFDQYFRVNHWLAFPRMISILPA